MQEMAFFSMWIAEATPDQLSTVKRLVDNRQLEFVVGGWTMEVGLQRKRANHMHGAPDT
jgi:hypothetical protein